MVERDVVSEYELFDDKGPVFGGYRLTILADRLACRVGEVIEIAHVCESLTPAGRLFVMGPKPVVGEYVDDRLVTEPAPEGHGALSPAFYDGRVVVGTGIDANYELTSHSFDAAGPHTIQWRLGPYVSNTLRIDVSDQV